MEIYVGFLDGVCNWTVPPTLPPESDRRCYTRKCCALVDVFTLGKGARGGFVLHQQPVELASISASLRWFPRLSSRLEVNCTVCSSSPPCPCCHKEHSRSLWVTEESCCSSLPHVMLSNRGYLQQRKKRAVPKEVTSLALFLTMLLYLTLITTK